MSRPLSEFARYLRTETTGGMILLGATALALVWANSRCATATTRCASSGSARSCST